MSVCPSCGEPVVFAFDSTDMPIVLEAEPHMAYVTDARAQGGLYQRLVPARSEHICEQEAAA